MFDSTRTDPPVCGFELSIAHEEREVLWRDLVAPPVCVVRGHAVAEFDDQELAGEVPGWIEIQDLDEMRRTATLVRAPTMMWFSSGTPPPFRALPGGRGLRYPLAYRQSIERPARNRPLVMIDPVRGLEQASDGVPRMVRSITGCPLSGVALYRFAAWT